MRGDEVMAAKRTTAQGGFAQRNAARDFARQTQKVGPMTARAVSPQAKCDRTGARAGFLPLGVLGGLGAKREEKIEFVMEFEIQFF